MTSPLRLVVFTDLDGTLIDHHSYDWSPARPALDVLHRIGAGVVLASSKTAPEIDQLRHSLNLQAWPAIVENGAGLLAPHAAPGDDRSRYDALRAILDALPRPLRAPFVGFGDMSVAEVAQVTGLSQDGAALARQRAFSEPGQWRGDDAGKLAFLDALVPHGVRAQQGGRFLTLSFGATKADQVRAISAQFAPQTTIALGDAPNDVEMLEICDFGVVIANPNADPLTQLNGEATGRIIRTSDAGPKGWNAAIMHLLAQLDLI